MTDSSGSPTTDGIDYVCFILDSSIAVFQRLASLTGLQPLNAVGQLVASGAI